MENKENKLVTSWDNYPELFSPEKAVEQQLSLVDLIADFLFTGNYYYYIIDIVGKVLSNHRANSYDIYVEIKKDVHGNWYQSGRPSIRFPQDFIDSLGLQINSSKGS